MEPILTAPVEEVRQRMRLDNPWWGLPETEANLRWSDLPQRIYLEPLCQLVRETGVNRAVVLMGPRRVGKTVIIHQVIYRLMTRQKLPAANLLYIPLDTPVYSGLALEKLLGLFREMHAHAARKPLHLFFDEIQHLKDWEIHLKSLVDTYPECRFTVSGSAGAALRLKSRESGAGRFTDFTLPPLTFCEYLHFTGKEDTFFGAALGGFLSAQDRMALLNRTFVNYIQFGGYPEMVFSEEVRNDPQHYIKSGIIDKVLLRDLPSLYGINDIPELNRLFVMLARNTGGEVNLPGLSKGSGVAKNTLARYLEYLEAAFLIKRIRRIDRNARRFQRERAFKVYLTNASMYVALFGPVDEGNSAVLGRLVETAVLNQLPHLRGPVEKICYAKWNSREVDFVEMDEGTARPAHAAEIKWSDRHIERHGEIAGLLEFAKRNPSLQQPLLATTRTRLENREIAGQNIAFVPAADYCYHVAKDPQGKLQTALPQAPCSPFPT